MAADSSRNNKYIYRLPFLQRSELCKILNQNDKWEELAGVWMNYDVLTIQNLRSEKDPTDELLTMWGHQNHTIAELFVLLSRMQHYQSMVPLLPFVDTKFHRLLHRGEGNLKNILRKQQQKENAKDLKIGAQNFNQCVQPQLNILKIVPEANRNHKILNQPMALLAIDGSDSNNLIVASPAPPVEQNIISDNKKINELSFPRTEATLPHASYGELGIATNGWNRYNILGKGGFGTVYRGTWKNTNVAIKRIERKERHDSDKGYMIQLQQSLTEIKILNSRPHENILALYAYSFGGDAPCLVYQLMTNGSLEDKLLVKRKVEPLNWIQRHEIAKGVARGLQYLHSIGEKPLIHGDIKSANILLDKNFEPRIGDFGLAREGLDGDSMKISRINGTRPYLPEDFLLERQLSTKVDTYSYGIVLFEMATGLLAYDESRAENKYLRDFIETWEEKDLPLLMDKKAGQKDSQVFVNFIILGKWCANRLAKHRPKMELVFQKLNDL